MEFLISNKTISVVKDVMINAKEIKEFFITKNMEEALLHITKLNEKQVLYISENKVILIETKDKTQFLKYITKQFVNIDKITAETTIIKASAGVV